jgi:N-acetyl-gamma-glutamylphosphate reductase
VCGHTGATGKALMDILVESPAVESVIAVGRRENEKYKNHPKVKQYIVPNMNEIGKEDLSIAKGCNAAFCTIGTPFMEVTDKNKQDQYRAVDFGIATEFAKFAKRLG